MVYQRQPTIIRNDDDDRQASSSLNDTSAIEREIDMLVYGMYDLTYDEVLIVDPETPITREEYNNFKF